MESAKPRSNTSLLLILGIAVLSMLVGWMLGRKPKVAKITTTESSTGVVEKLEKVFKLVSAEANVSEIYDYKDYNYYDIPLFRKKMLMRVNAKVLVGYDFEDAIIDINESSKTITLDSLSGPDILAIDHNLDYYDIQEGAFNSFTEEELTMIAERAKEFAKKTAEESDVFQTAEEQKQELLEMLELACRATGWDFVYSESAALKN